MGLGDFGLSVFASWLANRLDGFLGKQGNHGSEPEPAAPNVGSQPDDAEKILRLRKFNTFDAWQDLPKLLKVVKDPVISILIEDEPSTHYRLPSMVLESRATGEWYVFSRGRMSFEGDGGGIRNTRDILDQVKSAGATVGVWVVPQERLDELDSGYEVWANVRPHAVPLLAVISRNHSWSEIERNVSKYLEL